MMKCLATGQLRAFFGIALLAFGLEAHAVGMACSQVLLATSEISETQIESRIDNLARLKLSVDLALSAGGEQSIAQSVIGKQFGSELTEFIREARSTKSEAEIKKMISTRIRELQNRKSVEKEQEQVIRAESTILIPKLRGKYVLSNSIPLSISPSAGNRIFEFILETNSVLMELPQSSGKNLALYSLTSKRAETIVKNIRGAVLDRENQIVWALNLEGHLIRHNLASKTSTEIRIDQTPLAGLTDVTIDVSPAGDRLLIKSEKFLHLFDLNSRVLKQIANEVNVAKFISDEVAVLVPSNGDVLQRYDVQSGASTFADVYFDGVFDLYPTADRGHIVLRAWKSLHAVKASDLSGMDKNFIRMSDDPADYEMMLHTVKSVVGGNAFFVRHATSYSQLPELYIYDPQVGFEKLTQFDLPQGSEILNFTMSPSGDKAISYHKTRNGVYLDVWVGE